MATSLVGYNLDIKWVLAGAVLCLLAVMYMYQYVWAAAITLVMSISFLLVYVYWKPGRGKGFEEGCRCMYTFNYNAVCIYSWILFFYSET